MAKTKRFDLPPARTNADYLQILSIAKDGVPYDLTGCTFRMELREVGDYSGGSPLITLATVTTLVEGVGIWGDPTVGQIILIIARATLAGVMTTAIARKRTWYDLRITTPATTRDAPCAGELPIEWGATRG